MELSEEKKREYTKRLLLSRMRILCNNGFYGLLLMHLTFALDTTLETAATDGRKIYWSPDFLEKLTDDELDFVMMHEIMHVVLEHMGRQGDRIPLVFNIACDIVVNSNILQSDNMDEKRITVQDEVSMHMVNKQEGYQFTAEQVYEMILDKSKQDKSGGGTADGGDKRDGSAGKGKSGSKKSDKGMPAKNTLDDHSRWQEMSEEEKRELAAIWKQRIVEAAEAMSQHQGSIPAGIERKLKELKHAQTDWRRVLSEFVQEEVVDYSFNPPDRRYDGGDFYLPDFNETDIEVKDILFMIDTSGSMSGEMITAAFSEIKGAIEQFGGKLRGWLGFFDAEVIPAVPFEGVAELKKIIPIGGGGTRFDIIFDYMAGEFDELPNSIIILTDGFADFPDESVARGVPVMWLINNERVTAPWGKTLRITI